MSSYNIVYSDTLRHHGVKGMKWGVRKDPDRYIKYKNKYDTENAKLKKVVADYNLYGGKSRFNKALNQSKKTQKSYKKLIKKVKKVYSESYNSKNKELYSKNATKLDKLAYSTSEKMANQYYKEVDKITDESRKYANDIIKKYYNVTISDIVK